MRISPEGFKTERIERELSPEMVEKLRKLLEKDMAEMTAAFRKMKDLPPEQGEEIIELRPEWEIVEQEWQTLAPKIPEMKDPKQRKATLEKFEKMIGDSGLKM